MPNPSDTVVIVLANLMDRDGALNDETRGRLELGCAIARQVNAREVQTIGWAYREDTDLPIAEAMRREAEVRGLCRGVPVHCNTLSRDTVGDAVLSRLHYWPDDGGVTPIVATSDYHAARVRALFAHVWGRDIEVQGAPTPEPEAREASEAKSLAAFHETFAGVAPGDMAGCLDRLLTAHPFYNGTAMPDRPFDTDHPELQLVRG